MVLFLNNRKKLKGTREEVLREIYIVERKERKEIYNKLLELLGEAKVMLHRGIIWCLYPQNKKEEIKELLKDKEKYSKGKSEYI
jgi:23S rRNA A2030 N6-methylase RlmJ